MAEKNGGKVLDKLSTIAPGKAQTFVYNGEQIPNIVNIENDDTDEDANFVMESGVKTTWRYYGIVPAGGSVSVMLEWLDNEGTFYNKSPRSSIIVYGDGLFPKLHKKK
jgi:hypothetical protein